MEIQRVRGYYFSPTDKDLLVYLKQRHLDYQRDPDCSTNGHLIPDAELNKLDPEVLPDLCNRLSHGETNGREWFFFSRRKENYRNSSHGGRTVPNAGYWKITGSKKTVKSDDNCVEMGTMNTLTFYRGRVNSARLTFWGMHEYYINASYLSDDVGEMPFVVCRVFERSGKKGDDNLQDEALSDHFTSGFRAPTDRSGFTEEAGTQQSLLGIEQPLHDGSFTGMADNGDGSPFQGLNRYTSRHRTDDADQLCQGDWYSEYYSSRGASR